MNREFFEILFSVQVGDITPTEALHRLDCLEYDCTPWRCPRCSDSRIGNFPCPCDRVMRWTTWSGIAGVAWTLASWITWSFLL